MFSKTIVILLFVPFVFGKVGYLGHTRDPDHEEPCQVSDLECIRDTLAARSTCNKYRVWGCIPEESTNFELEYETPFFESSLRDQYTKVTGLDSCKVGDFRTNPVTNGTVLCIECRDVLIEANRSVRRHYPCEEDEQHCYHITGEYSSLILTMNLPDPDNLDICSERAYASFDKLPEVKITPSDRATKEFLSREENNILDNLEIYVREIFVSRASVLFRYVVNSLLCDYNC